MNSITLARLYADYVKYAPAIGLIATGIALITAKDYGPGAKSVLQGIALIAAGTAAVSLHNAIHAVPTGVVEAAKRQD